MLQQAALKTRRPVWGAFDNRTTDSQLYANSRTRAGRFVLQLQQVQGRSDLSQTSNLEEKCLLVWGVGMRLIEEQNIYNSKAHEVLMFLEKEA